MRALQVMEGGSAHLIEIEDPKPSPGEIVMHVQAVATCPQWDLHLRHNDPMFVGHKFHYPYTVGQPGHEATGVVQAIGSGVTEFQVGERVSAWRDAGHQRAGCYAELVALDAANVVHVPPDRSVEETASIELAMCVSATFLMLREMNAVAGTRFAVNGLGPAGLIAAQLARAEGAAEVVGFDLSDRRCRYALEKGPLDATFDPRSAPEEIVQPRSRPGALQSGIDCVGAKASVEWLMDHVRGFVALFGVQRETYCFETRHYHPPLRLCGYPGHSVEAARYAVSMIEQRRLDLAPLITHKLPLSRYSEGIDLLERQEAIKVLFLPRG